MAKKSFLIVGNWKMNPLTPNEAGVIYRGVRKIALGLKRTTSVICPPFLYLKEIKSSTNLFSGSQDIHGEMSGAYTGSVSAEMVGACGGVYSIVGHSERRMAGDSDEDVSKKVTAALRAGLIAILCIGEKERDEHGSYFETIKNQITTALSKVKKADIKKVVIAYEPVWAIGKEGKAATSRDVYEMTIFIKKVLSDLFDQKTGSSMKILYGGSVNTKNALEFLKEGNCDGLLVGRDSLNPKNFGEILTIADSI